MHPQALKGWAALALGCAFGLATTALPLPTIPTSAQETSIRLRISLGSFRCRMAALVVAFTHKPADVHGEVHVVDVMGNGGAAELEVVEGVAAPAAGRPTWPAVAEEEAEEAAAQPPATTAMDEASRAQPVPVQQRGPSPRRSPLALDAVPTPGRFDGTTPSTLHGSRRTLSGRVVVDVPLQLRINAPTAEPAISAYTPRGHGRVVSSPAAVPPSHAQARTPSRSPLAASAEASPIASLAASAGGMTASTVHLSAPRRVLSRRISLQQPALEAAVAATARSAALSTRAMVASGTVGVVQQSPRSAVDRTATTDVAAHVNMKNVVAAARGMDDSLELAGDTGELERTSVLRRQASRALSYSARPAGEAYAAAVLPRPFPHSTASGAAPAAEFSSELQVGGAVVRSIVHGVRRSVSLPLQLGVPVNAPTAGGALAQAPTALPTPVPSSGHTHASTLLRPRASSELASISEYESGYGTGIPLGSEGGDTAANDALEDAAVDAAPPGMMRPAKPQLYSSTAPKPHGRAPFTATPAPPAHAIGRDHHLPQQRHHQRLHPERTPLLRADIQDLHEASFRALPALTKALEDCAWEPLHLIAVSHRWVHRASRRLTRWWSPHTATVHDPALADTAGTEAAAAANTMAPAQVSYSFAADDETASKASCSACLNRTIGTFTSRASIWTAAQIRLQRILGAMMAAETTLRSSPFHSVFIECMGEPLCRMVAELGAYADAAVRRASAMELAMGAAHDPAHSRLRGRHHVRTSQTGAGIDGSPAGEVRQSKPQMQHPSWIRKMLNALSTVFCLPLGCGCGRRPRAGILIDAHPDHLQGSNDAVDSGIDKISTPLELARMRQRLETCISEVFQGYKKGRLTVYGLAADDHSSTVAGSGQTAIMMMTGTDAVSSAVGQVATNLPGVGGEITAPVDAAHEAQSLPAAAFAWHVNDMLALNAFVFTALRAAQVVMHAADLSCVHDHSGMQIQTLNQAAAEVVVERSEEPAAAPVASTDHADDGTSTTTAAPATTAAPSANAPLGTIASPQSVHVRRAITASGAGLAATAATSRTAGGPLARQRSQTDVVVSSAPRYRLQPAMPAAGAGVSMLHHSRWSSAHGLPVQHLCAGCELRSDYQYHFTPRGTEIASRRPAERRVPGPVQASASTPRPQRPAPQPFVSPLGTPTTPRLLAMHFPTITGVASVEDSHGQTISAAGIDRGPGLPARYDLRWLAKGVRSRLASFLAFLKSTGRMLQRIVLSPFHLLRWFTNWMGIVPNRLQAIRATKVTAGVTLAAGLGIALRSVFGQTVFFWAPVTATFLIGASEGGAFRTSLLRLQGTLAGAIYGYILVLIAGGSKFVIGTTLALWVGLMQYPRAHPSSGYWALVSAFSAAIVMLGLGPRFSTPEDLALGRIKQSILGICCFLAVSLVIFPVSARGMTRQKLLLALKEVRVSSRATLSTFEHFIQTQAAAFKLEVQRQRQRRRGHRRHNEFGYEAEQAIPAPDRVMATQKSSEAPVPHGRQGQHPSDSPGSATEAAAAPAPEDPTQALQSVDGVLSSLPELLEEAAAEPSLWRPPFYNLRVRYADMIIAVRRAARAVRVIHQCTLAMVAESQEQERLKQHEKLHWQDPDAEVIVAQQHQHAQQGREKRGKDRTRQMQTQRHNHHLPSALGGVPTSSYLYRSSSEHSDSGSRVEGAGIPVPAAGVGRQASREQGSEEESAAARGRIPGSLQPSEAATTPSATHQLSHVHPEQPSQADLQLEHPSSILPVPRVLHARSRTASTGVGVVHERRVSASGSPQQLQQQPHVEGNAATDTARLRLNSNDGDSYPAAVAHVRTPPYRDKQSRMHATGRGMLAYSPMLRYLKLLSGELDETLELVIAILEGEESGNGNDASSGKSRSHDRYQAPPAEEGVVVPAHRIVQAAASQGHIDVPSTAPDPAIQSSARLPGSSARPQQTLKPGSETAIAAAPAAPTPVTGSPIPPILQAASAEALPSAVSTPTLILSGLDEVTPGSASAGGTTSPEAQAAEAVEAETMADISATNQRAGDTSAVDTGEGRQTAEPAGSVMLPFLPPWLRNTPQRVWRWIALKSRAAWRSLIERVRSIFQSRQRSAATRHGSAVAMLSAPAGSAATAATTAAPTAPQPATRQRAIRTPRPSTLQLVPTQKQASATEKKAMAAAAQAAALPQKVSSASPPQETGGRQGQDYPLEQEPDDPMARLPIVVESLLADLEVYTTAYDDLMHELVEDARRQGGPDGRTKAARRRHRRPLATGAGAGQVPNASHADPPVERTAAAPQSPIRRQQHSSVHLAISDLDAICFNTSSFALRELCMAVTDVARLARRIAHTETATLQPVG